MVEEPRKPWKSPFWIWLTEKRKALGRELAQQVQVQDRLSSWVYVASADITKLGRQKWKALPDAAKKIYSAKADKLKEEYYEKMAAFLGAGSVVKGVRRADKKEAKDKKKKKKKKENGKKGPATDRKEARAVSGRPKKPPSSFAVWLGRKHCPRAQVAQAPVVGSVVSIQPVSADGLPPRFPSKTTGTSQVAASNGGVVSSHSAQTASTGDDADGPRCRCPGPSSCGSWGRCLGGSRGGSGRVCITGDGECEAPTTESSRLCSHCVCRFCDRVRHQSPACWNHQWKLATKEYKFVKGFGPSLIKMGPPDLIEFWCTEQSHRY